jgi:hypothetical protein
MSEHRFQLVLRTCLAMVLAGSVDAAMCQPSEHGELNSGAVNSVTLNSAALGSGGCSCVDCVALPSAGAMGQSTWAAPQSTGMGPQSVWTDPQSGWNGYDHNGHHQGLRVAIVDGVVTRLAYRDVLINRKIRLPEVWKPEHGERPWQFVVIHHSGTSSGSVESIHREHKQRKDSSGNNWLGIGYHFVIGNGSGMADGEISPTFRWNEQIHGAHSGSTLHNANGIGVCLIGNFEESSPTAEQLTALKRLLASLAERYRIPVTRVIGHSAVRATACPGKHFPFAKVLQQLKSIN